MNQEFITNVFVLLAFVSIGAIALGAAQLVVNLVQSWRGWRQDWGR